MGVKIKYTLEDFVESRIIDKFGLQKNGDADLFLANTCFRRMHKYVPFQTGALASTATVRPGSVTYEQPYAHKQYVGNKGKGIRGKYWDKKMDSAEHDLVAKEVENFIKLKKGNK